MWRVRKRREKRYLLYGDGDGAIETPVC